MVARVIQIIQSAYPFPCWEGRIQSQMCIILKAASSLWVKWHTPTTEQVVAISVSVSGGGAPSKGTITANIVDLDKNPPPNPVADDRE